MVNPTPGSITLKRSKKDIQVACEKPGHWKTDSVISSNFNGATMGNILLGGVIGVIVDASSGAMYSYKESVTIALVPEKFASIEKRDEFFETVIASIEDEAAFLAEAVKKHCDEEECSTKLKKIDEAKAKRIQEMEEKRAHAVVEQG